MTRSSACATTIRRWTFSWRRPACGPTTSRSACRLGTAQAAAGRLPEAVRTLDSYLTAHPEDHERLLIAMRAIYETRSAGKTIGTADEDRQRFNRYAAAYAAAGGPQQALVGQWKRFIDR